MVAYQAKAWLLRQIQPKRLEEPDPQAASDEKPEPQRIPTFEELAEVLPNLKKDLR